MNIFNGIFGLVLKSKIICSVQTHYLDSYGVIIVSERWKMLIFYKNIIIYLKIPVNPQMII